MTRLDGPVQVYWYDAQTGMLVRVCIGDDGFNYNGNHWHRGTQAFDRVLSIELLKSGRETLVLVLRSFCHFGLF
jgi:hypothetical protein